MQARTDLIANLEADLDGWSIATALQEHSPDSRRSSQSIRATGAEASCSASSNDEELEWEVETDEPEGTHHIEQPINHSEHDIEICNQTDDEARRLTDGVHPGEDYHLRQYAAHAIASALARSNEAATALANAFFASSGVVRSLLHLAFDADARNDPLTVDIVLACLTNLSGEISGSGITLIMHEGEAVASMLVRVLAEGHSTSSISYATACLCNLRAQPAVLAALETAPAAAARLRELGRTAHGDTASYAHALVTALQARTRGARAMRPASAAVRRNPSIGSLLPSSPRCSVGDGSMLSQTVRRVASFGRVRTKQTAPVLYSDLSVGLLAATNDLSAV